MDTDYIGKHRDDSVMAKRLCLFRDITVQEDERLDRPEFYVGTHSKAATR